MTLSNKTLVISTVIIAATAYGFGRWSAPEKVRVEVKTVEVEKKIIEKDKHKESTTTEVVKPDGTKTTTTTTVEETKTETKTDTVKNEDSSTETTYAASKITISALGGLPLRTSGPVTPVYGASISRPIFGPITLGVWGLTSSVVGVSIGLTF